MPAVKVFHKAMGKRALILAFAILLLPGYSQVADSTKSVFHVGGGVLATNNGISLLPTFTLGKPAVMFDIKAGNNRLTFEPQFRFAMEGKPWSYLFWWRYKLIHNKKFLLRIGTNPSISYRTIKIYEPNGDTTEVVRPLNFLAGEFAPNYYIRDNISVGIYYMHSHGFSTKSTRDTEFLTVNINFSNIRLSKKLYMRFVPQAYYLKMDGRDGFYATTSLALALKNFPLSIQSIMNQAIQSNIITKKDFVWNISLVYFVNKDFYKKDTMAAVGN